MGRPLNNARYHAINLVSYLTMITFNALANALPLNGMTTGEVSDRFPNLFTPAGFTFAIWGVIYVMLLVYVLYALRYSNRGILRETYRKISVYFAISSFANALWIVCWHYELIFLSWILMLVILVCLTMINESFMGIRMRHEERFSIRWPFSIYFGWILVATIANTTILFVRFTGQNIGFPQILWTILVLLLGVVLVALLSIRNKEPILSLVFLWTLFGILVNHLSSNGFGNAYPTIVLTVYASIVVMLPLSLWLIYLRRRADQLR